MTEPKKPQDHRPKAAEDEHPEGWDLLKPFEKIPAWDQMDLIAAVAPMNNVVSGKWKETDPQALRAMADVARALIPCVLDEDAYVAFSSGHGGIARAVNLAMAFAAQLGESEPSTIG